MTFWDVEWIQTFQRAPTLGGECYLGTEAIASLLNHRRAGFNGHPPLGVNATPLTTIFMPEVFGFNGHPPLGVNATGGE